MTVPGQQIKGFYAAFLDSRQLVILQLLFTYTRPFQAMFGNEVIPLRIWPLMLAGGLVFFLVVEAEKFVIRSSGSLRRAITAVEAGTEPALDYARLSTRYAAERQA